MSHPRVIYVHKNKLFGNPYPSRSVSWGLVSVFLEMSRPRVFEIENQEFAPTYNPLTPKFFRTTISLLTTLTTHCFVSVYRFYLRSTIYVSTSDILRKVKRHTNL